MGLFDKLFKKAKKVYSPLNGECVSITEVNDPTFAEKMLGDGVAIKPTSGEVYAPFDGTVSLVFSTKHALSLTSNDGIELLIHIGLDTVKLDGKHYDAKVKDGDTFKKGDLLMVADLEAIKAEGYDVITPVIVCNTQNYKTVTGVNEGSTVAAGDEVVSIS